MYLLGRCVCIVTCYMHTDVFIWTCEFVYINADHEYFFICRSPLINHCNKCNLHKSANHRECYMSIWFVRSWLLEPHPRTMSGPGGAPLPDHFNSDIRRSLRLHDICTLYPTSPALVEIMSCHLFGSRPLSEPRLAYNQPDTWEDISIKRRLIQ